MLRILFLICLFFTVFDSYSQNSLQLVNIRNKVLVNIPNGHKVKLSFIQNNNYQKTKGELQILNDSQLMVNGIVVPIDSIFKIGKPTERKKIFGIAGVAVGAGLTGLGTYFMYKLVTLENQGRGSGLGTFVRGLVYATVGSTSTVSGASLVGGGIYLINGSMKGVKSKRVLKVVYSDNP